MIMRGHHVIRTEEGDEVETERPFSAVCRCGGTARPPWCDGTHKVLARGPSRLR
nr:CDGSH iron-sulfur domain-containing protein [Aeromicrobium sp. PE09-221]